MITTIAFDADDTLWENEKFFQLTEADFRALLGDHIDGDLLSARLLEVERKNLEIFGYGIKGFILSMMETAIEVCDDRIGIGTIREIMDLGTEMLRHPILLFDGAEDVLETLERDYRLMLITKGDLFDQERKIAQSGLADYFSAIEIVTDKTVGTYQHLFKRHAAEADQTMMIGNSLKSDILPVLETGAWAVHVPHNLTWAHEHADAPENHARFRQVASISDVVDIIRELDD